MNKEIFQYGIYKLESPTILGKDKLEHVIVVSKDTSLNGVTIMNYSFANKTFGYISTVDKSNIGSFIKMCDNEIKENCIKSLRELIDII